ncbi:hypothetical protein [uncultured Dietzia sp.]|uniref:hypothetical protein n=1 Tax=uncultured Dietzia sp. TaxID=395519 RepID=UPI0025EE329F|nr:hypothetical protein [uncultured Dietzia sp.]
MRHDTTDRTISIFVPSANFMDGTFPPLFVGDVISVSLTFDIDVAQSTAGIETLDVTVHPEYGVAPGLYPDRTLRWPLKVTGDGWTAKWLHDEPFAGRLRVPGRLWPQFTRAIPGHPETTTGRVRRLQLVEEQYENAPDGKRRVPGTERVSDLGSSPDREWPRWTIIPTDDLFQPTAIVVDIDLDDVPDVRRNFDAGTISVNGADVWVMDKSHPTLVHIDTGPTPHRVTGYVLPLLVNAPTRWWYRRVHADAGGCWITSRDEIVRCNLDSPTELTLRRAPTEGADYTVALDGRLFVMPHPLITERDGESDGEPARPPVRELIDDELIPVTDEATIARARAASRRADVATTTDGTTWTANGHLTIQKAYEDAHAVDLQPWTQGQVNWVRPNAWSGTGIDQIAPGPYAPISGRPRSR